MKTKYWYLQHVPIIGIIYIIYNGFFKYGNDIGWSNVFYKNEKYIGNMYDWVFSIIIQSLSVYYILSLI